MHSSPLVVLITVLNTVDGERNEKKKKKILDAFNRFHGEESSPLLHPRCSPRNVARRWSGPPPPQLAAPICSSWPADLGPASSLPPDLVVPPLAAVEEREAITHRLSSSCCPVVCCTSWPPCICSSSEFKMRGRWRRRRQRVEEDDGRPGLSLTKPSFLLARSWPGRVVKLDLSVSAQPG